MQGDVFLDEYSRDENIARYVSRTAGAGIAYVLARVYAPIYGKAISAVAAERPAQHAYRVLEYGCGGGMNLLKLIELLESQGRRWERAVGADFSPPMVEAARKEAAEHLPPAWNARITFVTARNETLMADLSRGLGAAREELRRSFDFVVGVNTIRYSHRLGKAEDTVRDLYELLRPGGYSVMIDMNRRFPFFRSRMRDRRRPRQETYIPSLEEYVRPFRSAGFGIMESGNFCWIPHSARPRMLALCRRASPFLDACFSPFAMRSLVVARRPG